MMPRDRAFNNLLDEAIESLGGKVRHVEREARFFGVLFFHDILVFGGYDDSPQYSSQQSEMEPLEDRAVFSTMESPWSFLSLFRAAGDK